MDSLQVVQAIRANRQNLRPCEQIVDDTRMILGMQPSWMVSHIKREANTTAHCLAKTALSCSIEHIWMEKIPNYIHDTVLLEQSTLSI
jgi:hypothetical protein